MTARTANLARPLPAVRRAAGRLATLAAAAALAACGGGDVGPSATGADGGRPVALGVATVIPPLVDEQGHPMPPDPRAQPADAAAWTAAGRYATPAQARQLLDAGADAMAVDVRCCGIEAADEAVGIVFALQATGVPDDTLVLVRGEDLRLAAAVANRLTSGGMTRVWLVTP